MDETLALLSLLEKISPLELILVWLLSNVSNQPLPDLCMEIMAKYLTGWQEHSSLNHSKPHKNTSQYKEPRIIKAFSLSLSGYLLYVFGLG